MLAYKQRHSARSDLKPILELDPAKLTDQVFSYTREHLGGFEIVEIKRGRSNAVALLIELRRDSTGLL